MGSDTTDTISTSKMHLPLATFLSLSLSPPPPSPFLLPPGDKILQKQVISGQRSCPTVSNKKDKRISNHCTSKSAFKNLLFHPDATMQKGYAFLQHANGAGLLGARSPPAFQHHCTPGQDLVSIRP